MKLQIPLQILFLYKRRRGKNESMESRGAGINSAMFFPVRAGVSTHITGGGNCPEENICSLC